MNNAVAFRIASDMGYARPNNVSLQAYTDQLKYGALSEWIRTITNDTDPLMGSNRIGVTREYLVTRAAEVLRDLSRAVDGLECTAETATELTQWMVDKMLFVGELWEPIPGNLLCMPSHVVEYRNGFARVTGQKAGKSTLRQVGICHYGQTQANEATAAQFMQQKIGAEKHLVSIAPEFNDKLGYTEAECLTNLRGLASVSTRTGQIDVRADINTLPEYLQRYLLSRAWPNTETPLSWTTCEQWLIPTT